MAKKVFNMQGGRHSAAALSSFINAMYGSSVANGLDVQVTGSAGLNVLVKIGNGIIDTGTGFGRLIQIDADETVALTAASASNPRNDIIVAYIDNSVTPTTAVTDNTNNILKFAAVAGTPAGSPTDPSGSAIQAAVGAGNPYMILGRVRVNTSATSLTAPNITDLRAMAGYIGTLQRAYPVGSIYFNASVSTNPATLLGFGTWVAWGAGRVPVGFDSGQTEFDTVEETGGAKTHTLSIPEMPSHRHDPPNGTKYVGIDGSAGAANGAMTGGGNYRWNWSQNDVGGGLPHNNLQPYIVTYMWKRTA